MKLTVIGNLGQSIDPSTSTHSSTFYTPSSLPQAFSTEKSDVSPSGLHGCHILIEFTAVQNFAACSERIKLRNAGGHGTPALGSLENRITPQNTATADNPQYSHHCCYLYRHSKYAHAKGPHYSTYTTGAGRRSPHSPPPLHPCLPIAHVP